MSLVGDRERERAALALRRHYVAGRLDETELSERLDRVLRARGSWDIAYALRRLPRLEEIAARFRYALVVVVTLAVWLILSIATFVAFLASLVAHGATSGLVAFPIVWLALTALLYWRTRVTRRQHHRF